MEQQNRQKFSKDTHSKISAPKKNDTSGQLAKSPYGGNQIQQLQSKADNSGLVSGLTQFQSIANVYSDSKPPIQRKENSTGLPDNLKSGVENLSGMSLDDVKVHRNSDRPAQLNAHAYAQGSDIHLGPGQEKHLPHEAWHVVQQKQGRVKPTRQMKGKVNVNDDAGLEKEADIMGKKALLYDQINADAHREHSVSYDSNLTQFVSSLQKTIQMEPGEDDSEPDMTPREAIGNEEDLTAEDMQALQELNGTNETSILKFNFAGSGEEMWKTHKDKYKSADKDFGSQDSDYAGKKYKKEKQTIGGHKTVFEYAGPIKTTLGKKGIVDEGENSTERNLADAKIEMQLAMNAILMAKARGADPSIEVNIKGFSRGAATATVFANWIKENYPDVPVNLVAIDPVHGTGSWDEKTKGTRMGKMDTEQDLSAIDNSTYVLPIASGHWGKNFTPQRVFNYTRIIIMYGPNVKHSMGMGGNTGSVLTYNGQPIKGTKLGTLPPGLLVADSTDPENIPIQRINTLEQWESVSPRILGGGYIKKKDRIGGKADVKVNAKEKRDVMVSQALEQFIKNGQVQEYEMFDNPAFNPG